MLELNFHPFPVIETKRLILRNISMDDKGDFFRMRTNIAAMKYLHRDMPKDETEVVALIEKIQDNLAQNNGIMWIVTLKENLTFAGTIGYHVIEKQHCRAEIGYQMHPDFWNQGIMTEAISEVIAYGFTSMKLHSIEAHVNPGNTASSKLLLKHQFIKEAQIKENFFYSGTYFDTDIYSLLEPEKKRL